MKEDFPQNLLFFDFLFLTLESLTFIFWDFVIQKPLKVKPFFLSIVFFKKLTKDIARLNKILLTSKSNV